MRHRAPCYFKLEPGESEKGVYTAWADAGWQAERARNRVRFGQILTELAQRTTLQAPASLRPS